MSMYRQPPVELGDIVYWYDTPDTNQAHVAIVTRLGTDSINVNKFDPQSYNTQIRDGVRHRSDPRCQRPEMRHEGCWDYAPETKRRMELEYRVAALEADVTTLMTSATAPVMQVLEPVAV